MKLKELFKNSLSKEELTLLPTSFDTVGDVAIFNDFPGELKSKEKEIAKKIIESFKHINVVAKKSKQYAGEFRTPKITILAGEKRKTTLHKENGVRLKVDVEKTYFSARSATERERIIKQVKPNEQVLIMFSGVGPLAIEISKHAKAKEIVGVEINPLANNLAKENAQLNKCKNTTFIEGDVNKILPKLGKFDRIAMPLPKSASEFLPLAITKASQNAIIHLYTFDTLENIPKLKRKFKTSIKNANLRFLRVVKAGQYSPKIFRLCFDIKVTFK